MNSRFYFYKQFDLSAQEFKHKALDWANTFPVSAYYENNQILYPYQGFDNFLAVSKATKPIIDPVNAFPNLLSALPSRKNLLCGFFSYDLKNQVEKLSSENQDRNGFPLIYFFEPEITLLFEADGFEIISPERDSSKIVEAILNARHIPANSEKNLVIKHRTSREEYLKNVRAIQQHILEGDVYELNYCIEFYAEEVAINPLHTFLVLNQASPMPFAGYFKWQNNYLLCASPERSLKKENTRLISQPIKGTIRRSADKQQDEIYRAQLQNSEKEISENMMIMDLVRNDLAKSSEVGSVKVEEMFGIYGFQHLYQMITTVTSTIGPYCSITDAIKNAFPMGSMTGAPKIRAMELIDLYENTRRGLFSGSLGYIKPNGDFDFNVIIRSLQYNAQTKYLSFMVGSAITYESDPEQEYEECFLKARAILGIFKNK